MRYIYCFLVLVGCNDDLGEKLPGPKYNDMLTVEDPFYGSCEGPIIFCYESYDCHVCTVEAKCTNGAKPKMSAWFNLYSKRKCSVNDQDWTPRH